MKKIILFSIAVLAFTAGGCNNSSKPAETTNASSGLDTTKLKSGDTFYQCEMDPKVISDKPGTCPTCGMDLQKVVKK